MTTPRRSARLNNPIPPSLDAPSYQRDDDDDDDPGPTTTAAMPPPPRRRRRQPQSSDDDGVDVDPTSMSSRGDASSGAKRVFDVARAEGGEGGTADRPASVVAPPPKEAAVDNDEDDDDDDDSDPTSRTTLREEVGSRRSRLERLLQGREGTAYADAMLGREDLVNSRLLLLDGESTMRRGGGGAIRCALLEECHHALPAAFSLVVHCVLYYQFYAIVSAFADWLCYSVVARWCAGGWWGADGFYASALLLSVLAGRVTGTLYDWNDSAPCRMLIEMQLRNRWHLQSWDARLMNYFSGDAIRSRHERRRGGGEGVGREDGGGGEHVDNAALPIRVRRGARWGPGAKRVLDLISFFLCYKSVEHFLWRVGPSTTPPPPSAMVNEGAPRPPPPPGQRGGGRSSSSSSSSISRGRRRVSHACTAVVGALGNPYASEILDWIASRAAESDDDVVARGYVANAMNCGWSGPRTTTTSDDDGDHPWLYYDGNDESTDSSTDVVEANDDESDRPTTPIAEGGNVIAPPDDDYDDERRNVVLAACPIPGPVDWWMEQLFVFASTAICLGLLYACGIPFLLI